MEGEAQGWENAYWGLYSDVVAGLDLLIQASQRRISPDDAITTLSRLLNAALSRAERDILALIDNE